MDFLYACGCPRHQITLAHLGWPESGRYPDILGWRPQVLLDIIITVIWRSSVTKLKLIWIFACFWFAVLWIAVLSLDRKYHHVGNCRLLGLPYSPTQSLPLVSQVKQKLSWIFTSCCTPNGANCCDALHVDVSFSLLLWYLLWLPLILILATSNDALIETPYPSIRLGILLLL